MFEATQRQLLNRLQKEPQLVERLAVLKNIRGVGEVTALTWALEICDPQRFRSIEEAVSYCGPERDAIKPRSIFGEPQSRRRHIAPR
jgi:transposase